MQGPLNDIGLSLVVTDLLSECTRKQHEEFRCSLELGDKNLVVNFIKRDEGFESDGGESTRSMSTEEVNNNSKPNDIGTNSVEEKIIKDHVFKIRNLEDTSSANSSGSDSDENSNSKNSVTSSQSTSPTSDLQKYKFDHKDAFPISDVLICHTDQEFSNCLVWVIRTKSGDLEALVLECNGETEVKEVYRKFLEVSKRSKLERHRRRKSDGGSVVTRSVEALFSRSKKSNSNNHDNNNKTKSIHLSSHEASALEKVLDGSNKVHQLQKSTYLDQVPAGKGWNLIQHTDRNGVTHIEVESQATQAMKKEQQEEHWNKVGIKARPNNLQLHSEKSKFAKELENILSKELANRKEREAANIPALSPSAVSSNNNSSSKGAIPRSNNKSTSPGESQSLRQRAPALLLRKLDEFEEKAHKVWSRGGDSDEDNNRKVWSRPNVQPSKAASRTPPPPSRKSESLWRQHFHYHSKQELHNQIQSLNVIDTSVHQSPSQQSSDNNSPKVTARSAIKIRAPSPPAAVSNNVSIASPKVVPKRQQEQHNVMPTEKQILIPTKTGKEPVKKLYPKEAPPRIVHVTPISSLHHPAALQFAANQPHSLPIYPVQLTAAPIAWARYPSELPGDPGLIQAQWAASRGVPAVLQPSPAAIVVNRGRSRDRNRANDVRRAQSKSPARLKSAQGSMSSSSNISSEMSKKLRELSDAVRLKIGGGKRNTPAPLQVGGFNPDSSSVIHATSAPTALKSNLKKSSIQSQESLDSSFQSAAISGGQNVSVTVQNHHNEGGHNSNSPSQDNKKVHFNKFATVQMME